MRWSQPDISRCCWSARAANPACSGQMSPSWSTAMCKNLGDLLRLLKSCDAVIYCIGILREFRHRGITFEALQYSGLVRVVEAAEAAGVGRLLLMSANGAAAGGTLYQDTKYRAERHALGCAIPTTVFRPSVIFGDPRGRSEFATQLRSDMVLPPFPAADFFNMRGENKGAIRMSPVHVADVAAAFVAALDDDSTVGQTIDLGGPESLTWREMIEIVCDVISRRKVFVPMPIELMRIAALLLDWLPFFPVTRDQLTMLSQGNTVGSGELTRLIQRPAQSFSTTTLSYLA